MSTISIAQAEVQKGEDRDRIEPGGFLYGVALGVQRELYEDFDRRVVIFPVLGYRGERLKIFGPFVSYTLIKDGNFEFSAQAKPRFAGFDESDSDIFDGMEDRKSSLDIGLGLNYEKDNWKIEVSGLRDALDRSNGSELGAKIGKVFRVGPVFIEPAIGLSYLDRKHVDYYYGVEALEASANRPEYDGDSALNTTLGISFTTPIFFDGFTRIGIENSWFDSSIEDSPLTDADTNFRILFTFSKFFEQ